MYSMHLQRMPRSFADATRLDRHFADFKPFLQASGTNIIGTRSATSGTSVSAPDAKQINPTITAPGRASPHLDSTRDSDMPVCNHIRQYAESFAKHPRRYIPKRHEQRPGHSRTYGRRVYSYKIPSEHGHFRSVKVSAKS